MELSYLTAEILRDLYGAYQMQNTPTRYATSLTSISEGQTCQWTQYPNGRCCAHFSLQSKEVALRVDVILDAQENSAPEIEIYLADEIESIGHITNADEWRRFATACLEPLVDSVYDDGK